MNLPFFSIIVCTRNRPDILQCCILALKNQSFKDFEVILSDNSDHDIQELNSSFIKKLNFKQLKYIKPERKLNMHENYNFGLKQANGQYIGVLTDKNLFKKHALRDLSFVVCNKKVDIINYNHGGCRWYPNKLLFKWILDSTEVNPIVEPYSPEQELLRRFNLSENIRREGVRYNFGKIFFGFYHYSLIQKIIESYGHVFHPISPDYTSTVLALNLAKEAIFYHKKIMIAVNNYFGTGYSGQTKPNFTLNFIENCVEDSLIVLKSLPIPYVYTLHNLCAYDYLILKRLGNTKYNLNIKNLVYLTQEDLQIFPYSSEEEKIKFLDYFDNFTKINKIEIDYSTPNNNLADIKNEKIIKNNFITTYIKCLIKFIFRVNKIAFLKCKYTEFCRNYISLNTLLKYN